MLVVGKRGIKFINEDFISFDPSWSLGLGLGLDEHKQDMKIIFIFPPPISRSLIPSLLFSSSPSPALLYSSYLLILSLLYRLWLGSVLFGSDWFGLFPEWSIEGIEGIGGTELKTKGGSMCTGHVHVHGNIGREM